MENFVRPQIYSTMPVGEVEAQLRHDRMPAPFTRRMRVINLLSAVTLRKIEDNMIAPFEVMELRQILDAQVSQDAIIGALENKNVALALKTGNLQPLWVESKDNPLLRQGFEQGWIQRFNKLPFDPICVMLAMRAKLMLDVVDELGHSYDLLRKLGMGWIDFGEIPGEEPGDADSYIPPLIDAPIDYPIIPGEPVPEYPEYVPGPGEPGYIPPGDMTPGDPGYTTTPDSPGYIPPGDMTPGDPGYTTTPDSPGYIPPGDMTPGDPGYTTTPDSPGYIPPGDIVPGEPGYVPTPGDQHYIPPPDRVPGDPGYPRVSGEAPGYPPGWDEGVFPGHPDYEAGPGEPGYTAPPSPGGGYYGGDYGPGGSGAHGGPGGAGGIYGNLAPPLNLIPGPGSLFGGGWSSRGGGAGAIDCCADKDDPEATVGIGYYTQEMGCGDEQGLIVSQAHAACGGENYEWMITAGGGELSAETGLDVIYTAPTSGHGCPGNTEITLYCAGEIMATLDITIDYEYSIEWNYGTSAAEIARNTSELVYVTANNTPLTWSVSGTGFALEHAETDGCGNVLHADGTACGSATITVTGCDSQETTGSVRCTAGQWVLQGNAVYSGNPDPTRCCGPVGGGGGCTATTITEIVGDEKWWMLNHSCFGHCLGYEDPCVGLEGISWSTSSGVFKDPPCGSPSSCAPGSCTGMCGGYNCVGCVMLDAYYYKWEC